MTGNSRNAMVYDARYLQNEFGDLRFFYVFNLILSFSTCSESFEKICAWELLGANVLKRKKYFGVRYTLNCKSAIFLHRSNAIVLDIG